MAKRYKIHPAIGYARVGTSTQTFLGPEVPGTYAKPDDGKYRDADGRLKRQAARFWVFEYDDANPAAEPVPVFAGTAAAGNGGVPAARIEWTVHLANKKAVWFNFAGVVGEGPAGYPPGHPLRNPSITDPAERRKKLVIDPRPRTVVADGTAATAEVSKGTSGDPAAETWPPPFTGGKRIESLGTLKTDDRGRLTVAGGFGTSGTPGPLPPDGHLNYDNNDDWFDDVSDGPVTARIVFADGSTADATPAWVIVGPPDYAPPIENIVTTYDLLYDLGLREFGLDPSIFDPAAGKFRDTFQPSFTRHVFPILRRALEYRWVIKQAASHLNGAFDLDPLAAPPAPGEDPDNNPRAFVFQRLRDPDNIVGPPLRDMPRLHNDGIGGVEPETFRFTVTRFQFFVMRQWAAGRFSADWPGTPPPPPPAGAPVTAAGLDRAAMEAACGGSFFPGMEAGWILRDPRVYLKPFEFRFRHAAAEGDPTGLTAGDASKRMALPWQADFLKCGSNWWPAQRPNEVRTGSGSATKRWDRPLSPTNGHVKLVAAWSELGLVAPDPASPGAYREVERVLPET